MKSYKHMSKSAALLDSIYYYTSTFSLGSALTTITRYDSSYYLLNVHTVNYGWSLRPHYGTFIPMTVAFGHLL